MNSTKKKCHKHSYIIIVDRTFVKQKIFLEIKDIWL